MMSSDESLPLPPSQEVEAPSPTVPTQTSPAESKRSIFDRASDVASAIGNSVQQGLSYANARRARSTYRG